MSEKGLELELNQKMKSSIRESFLADDSNGKSSLFDEQISSKNPAFLGDNSSVFEDDFNLANDAENQKAKTSLRMTYEAQTEVIKRQLGDLEQIREKLGLSQRKMAQLLLVDPSSWSRWTKKGDEAPPQVWRALQWYMALQGKIPGLQPQYFFSEGLRNIEQLKRDEIDTLRKDLMKKMSSLESQVQFYKKISFMMAGFLMASIVIGFLFLGR